MMLLKCVSLLGSDLLEQTSSYHIISISSKLRRELVTDADPEMRDILTTMNYTCNCQPISPRIIKDMTLFVDKHFNIKVGRNSNNFSLFMVQIP